MSKCGDPGWPRGRWLVCYGKRWGTLHTLKDAKWWVDRLIRNLRDAATAKMKYNLSITVRFPAHAIIVKLGTSTVYHGRFDGPVSLGVMKYKRVKPCPKL